MNAILQVIGSFLVALLERMHVWSRTGVDGDRDDNRLRRAGSRIRDWMQQSRADSRVKPNASGASNAGPDLHDGGREMDSVGQQGPNP